MDVNLKANKKRMCCLFNQLFLAQYQSKKIHVLSLNLNIQGRNATYVYINRFEETRS